MLSDAELGGSSFPQDLLDAIDTYAAYTADPEMELKAEMARADVVNRLRKIIAQAKLANQLQAQIDRAFSMLAAYGVPKERARYVANGIDVLATRYRKSDDALEAQLAKARSDALEVVDCFNYLSGKCRCQWSGITLEEVKRATKEKP